MAEANVDTEQWLKVIRLVRTSLGGFDFCCRGMACRRCRVFQEANRRIIFQSMKLSVYYLSKLY